MKQLYVNKQLRNRIIGILCLVIGIEIIIVTLFYLSLNIHEVDQTRLLKNSHGNVVFGCIVALFGLEYFVSEQRKTMLRNVSALIAMSLLIQFWW